MRAFPLRSGARIPAVGVALAPSADALFAHARAALLAGAPRLDGSGAVASARELARALDDHGDCGHAGADGADGCPFVSWRLAAVDAAEPRRAVSALHAVLAALPVDRLDLVLVPWVASGHGAHGPAIVSIGATLSALRADGRAAAVGVIDAPARALDVLARAGLLPDVVEAALDPRHPAAALVAACSERDVHLTASAPLGPDVHFDGNGRAHGGILDHPVVREVADRLAVSPAQALLAWNLTRGVSVSSPAATPAKILRHLDTPHVVLARADVAALDTLAGGRAQAAVA